MFEGSSIAWQWLAPEAAYLPPWVRTEVHSKPLATAATVATVTTPLSEDDLTYHQIVFGLCHVRGFMFDSKLITWIRVFCKRHLKYSKDGSHSLNEMSTTSSPGSPHSVTWRKHLQALSYNISTRYLKFSDTMLSD